MKILYINTFYAPNVGGGAEITLQTLVNGVRARGHEVVVLTTGPAAGVHEDLVAGVRVIRVGLKNIYWPLNVRQSPGWKRFLWHLGDIYNLAMGKWVERIVRQEKPDVVSCHNLSGFSAATWKVVKRTGTPLVQVLHDLYNICPNSSMFRDGHACSKQCFRCKAFRLFHPHLSESVDAVVGVSNFILERHLQYGYFSKAKIRIAIHNARNMHLPQIDREPLDSNKNVKFGFIGNISPIKGIEMLLQCFTGLKLQNAELYIAGKGKQNYVASLQRSYKSYNNIRFLGYTEPGKFFPEIDVLIVPSLWEEALGMVVPEAFAYGVPVIGSRRGGIPEMIKDGSNGFIFDPDKPGKLLELLNLFIENREIIEKMRPVAQKSALPFLDMDKWTDRYTSLYEKITQTRIAGE